MPRSSQPSNSVRPRAPKSKSREKLDIYIYRLILQLREARNNKLGLNKKSMRVFCSIVMHIHRQLSASIDKLMNIGTYKTVTTDVVKTALTLVFPENLYPHAFTKIAENLQKLENA